MLNRDYKTTRSDDETTRRRDNQTKHTAARRGQPPSPGYGVPVWSVVSRQSSVVSRLREATARHGSQPARRSLGAGGWSSRESAFTLAKQRDPESVRGFTLAELLVSMGVLVLLVLLFTQLLNSAATTTTLGHKLMDADSQARQLLDRMALDFGQMLKRTDVSFYVKTLGNTQVGNDQIAFFSAVPGYGSGSDSKRSPLSLVAYRVNNDPASQSYNKLERLGKSLDWNGASTPDTMVVKPLTISAMWPYATNEDPNAAYEVIGPDVFRFEYYYLLNSSLAPPENNQLSAGRWSSTDVFSVKDVAAIVVAIAVIEPKSKALLDTVDPTRAKLKRLNGADGAPPLLVDYDAARMTTPGQLLTAWRTALDANTVGLPQPAVSGIRLYERYFYLSQ